MRVRVEPGVATTALDHGGLVVLSESTGKLHQCNPTAAAIWQAWETHDGDTDAAAAAVARHYCVAAELVLHDMDALLGPLTQAGLVRVES